VTKPLVRKVNHDNRTDVEMNLDFDLGIHLDMNLDFDLHLDMNLDFDLGLDTVVVDDVILVLPATSESSPLSVCVESPATQVSALVRGGARLACSLPLPGGDDVREVLARGGHVSVVVVVGHAGVT